MEDFGQKITSAEEVALESVLNNLLEQIRRQESVEAADSCLNQLGCFQTELARACFKWSIPLPAKLRRLVREFDRSDDYELRLAVFNQIKQGTFLVSE